MPFAHPASPSRWVGAIVSSGRQFRSLCCGNSSQWSTETCYFVSAMKPLPPVFLALGQDRHYGPSLRFRDMLRGIRVDRGAFR